MIFQQVEFKNSNHFGQVTVKSHIKPGIQRFELWDDTSLTKPVVVVVV